MSNIINFPHKFNRNLYYILDRNYNVIPASSVLEWAQWFTTSKNIVKRNKINDILISTIFLGIDHNLSFVGQTILWETAIFNGKLDGHLERYSCVDIAKKKT